MSLRYVVPPDVVCEELDGETVILNLRTGMYFALNGTATRVWKSIAACGDVADVCEAIAREYGEPLKKVEADVAALLSQLTARSLLLDR